MSSKERERLLLESSLRMHQKRVAKRADYKLYNEQQEARKALRAQRFPDQAVLRNEYALLFHDPQYQQMSTRVVDALARKYETSSMYMYKKLDRKTFPFMLENSRQEPGSTTVARGLTDEKLVELVNVQRRSVAEISKTYDLHSHTVYRKLKAINATKSEKERILGYIASKESKIPGID